MDRIKKLCSYLNSCKTFADIGCDHGYAAKYMLDNSLCQRALISDLSPKCLKKAETLLAGYIKNGKCESVCCYGLEKTDPQTELTLIAGMGGEEIISIIKAAYVPLGFVLQPMRNVREVREFLLEAGAEITRDELFESGGKYYFVICGKRQGEKSQYSSAQLKYGKGDIKGVLGRFLKEELEKKRGYLARGVSEESRRGISEDISLIEEMLKGETV